MLIWQMTNDEFTDRLWSCVSMLSGIMCFRFLVSLGDYEERRINVWETSNYTLIASTVTNSSLHHIAWDPQAFNEFVTVGDNGSIMFWLIDEISDKKPKLRVQEPDIPDEVSSLSNRVSSCSFVSQSQAADEWCNQWPQSFVIFSLHCVSLEVIQMSRSRSSCCRLISRVPATPVTRFCMSVQT